MASSFFPISHNSTSPALAPAAIREVADKRYAPGLARFGPILERVAARL
ncbi:MAG TPA: hypothetical protein VHH35_16720 [Pyrinomonadaceae bacterium]|nr:hypothetical protein [Pyrinomonadaceae bacterium]